MDILMFRFYEYIRYIGDILMDILKKYIYINGLKIDENS